MEALGTHREYKVVGRCPPNGPHCPSVACKSLHLIMLQVPLLVLCVSAEEDEEVFRETVCCGQVFKKSPKAEELLHLAAL